MKPEIFYVAANVKFSNKFEALEYALKKDSPISFEIDSNFWQNQDWLRYDPTIPLDTLYRFRAEQLRNKYDYIILCYSGGPDSWNILETFRKNKIHLDEIVSWHTVSMSKQKHSYQNKEVFEFAKPTAENFIKENPRTKFTLLDIKEPIIDVYKKYNTFEKQTLFTQYTMTFSSPMVHGWWFYSIPRYTEMLNQGKKVCLLWGEGKTTLSIVNNKYAFQFADFFAQMHRKPDDVDEMFYWTKDMPEIVITQSHIIKKFLDRLTTEYNDPFKHQIPVVKTKLLYQPTKLDVKVSFNMINRILYGNGFYAEEKPTGTKFITSWDNWILKHLNEDIVETWKKSMKNGYNQFKKVTEINRDESNPNFGNTPILLSRPYFLE